MKIVKINQAESGLESTTESRQQAIKTSES